MPTSDDILRLLKSRPEQYLYMMGFKQKSSAYHKWMKEMVFGKSDHSIQAFRGSGKTTCVSASLAMLMFLYPNKRIAFMRKTDSDVKEVVKQVRRMLESEETKALTSIIWGHPLSLVVASQTELSTNLTNDPRGSSQLTGMGINGSLTGKHYDVIFTDDIINLKDRVSRAEREHTKSVYMELQNIKNRDGRIFNTLTPWHIEDASIIMPSAEKWDYLSMPEVISQEEADKIKARMTPSLWAANYELRHIPSDDVIFTNPQTGAKIELAMDGVAHVDAAYYGEDFTAFSVMNIHDGKRYTYGRIWRKHVQDVTAQIVEECKRLRVSKLYMESNADKGYAAKDFKAEGLRVSSYHEGENKYIKIVTHLKSAWPDIIFCEGTDQAYINQICDYTEDAEHDDAPDSLACLCQRCKPQVEYSSPFVRA